MLNHDRAKDPLDYAVKRKERGQTLTLASDVAFSTWRTPNATEPGISQERLLTKDGEPWMPGQRAYDAQTGRVCQVGLTHEIQATWPNPMASERSGQGERNVSLMQESRKFWKNVAINSGTMMNGSQEPMEKRGALNPAFVFWLMGFPDEWVNSVSRATQSFRKSRRRS